MIITDNVKRAKLFRKIFTEIKKIRERLIASTNIYVLQAFFTNIFPRKERRFELFHVIFVRGKDAFRVQIIFLQISRTLVKVFILVYLNK